MEIDVATAGQRLADSAAHATPVANDAYWSIAAPVS
jgi:hypothetical protein